VEKVVKSTVPAG